MDGNANLLSRYAIINKERNLSIATANNPQLNSLSELRTERAKMAMISSTSNMPTTMRPCNVCNSRLSDNNFITTIVDENAIIRPIYPASKLKNPNKRATVYPKMNNKTIWIIPPILEIKATLCKDFKSISKPTKNNKKAIPMMDMDW